MERIQKRIANSGYTSRRKAEELIKRKQVYVNGELAVLGMQVSPKDEVKVEGNTIAKEEKVYYLLYKPKGVVTTTSDDKHRETVIDIVKTDKRIYPVGRLDYDTTGVLILTNDGDLTNFLTHPSNNIEKTYVAKVKGIVTYENLKKLKTGVFIDGFKTSPAKAKIIKFDKEKKATIVELTIHEGKNHQVKNMFESLGYEVEKLKREKEAFLDLKGLRVGEYRSLTPHEVKRLYGEVKK